LKPAIAGEHFALVEAAPARRGANRVGRFDDQQRLVAIDQVDRLQLAFEMRRELFALELHSPLPASLAWRAWPHTRA
jgi:hypothetical protein